MPDGARPARDVDHGEIELSARGRLDGQQIALHIGSIRRRSALTGSAANGLKRSAMTGYDLRQKNARLRDKIDQLLEKHPELRDVPEEIALEQGMHVEVGTPFLERVQGKLQERARAIIERRPDLEHYFDD